MQVNTTAIRIQESLKKWILEYPVWHYLIIWALTLFLILAIAGIAYNLALALVLVILLGTVTAIIQDLSAKGAL